MGCLAATASVVLEEASCRSAPPHGCSLFRRARTSVSRRGRRRRRSTARSSLRSGRSVRIASRARSRLGEEFGGGIRGALAQGNEEPPRNSFRPTRFEQRALIRCQLSARARCAAAGIHFFSCKSEFHAAAPPVLSPMERSLIRDPVTRPVEDWGSRSAIPLPSPRCDRFLHHGHVLECGPRSFRTPHQPSLPSQAATA